MSGSKHYPRNIQSLFQRWTPGQYDRPSDQSDYPDANKSHTRRYSFRRARGQILVPGFAQLLITCILIAGLVGTFDGYAKQQTLDTSQRHTYNFLMTGLINKISQMSPRPVRALDFEDSRTEITACCSIQQIKRHGLKTR